MGQYPEGQQHAVLGSGQVNGETLDGEALSLGFQAAMQVGQQRWPARGGVNEWLAQHDQFGRVKSGHGDASAELQIVRLRVPLAVARRRG